MNCDTCHHNAMSQTGLSAYSYMEENCPQCLNNQGVCNNQNSFNNAFHKAVKYYNKRNQPPKWSMLILLGVMVALIVWALVLAGKVPVDNRLLHYVLAFVFSPVYIISSYIGN